MTIPFKKKKTEVRETPQWIKDMQTTKSPEHRAENLCERPAPKKEVVVENKHDIAHQESILAQQHIENVRLVAAELRDKYKAYEEMRAFVNYIESVEEVFTRVSDGVWSPQEMEKDLVYSEIYRLSVSSGIDENVFNTIYGDFTNSVMQVDNVQAVTEHLIKKYSDCEQCIDLIMYIRDLVIVLSHEKGQAYSMDQQKEAIIKARMKVLSADGHPPFFKLETIFKEFVAEMNSGMPKKNSKKETLIPDHTDGS